MGQDIFRRGLLDFWEGRCAIDAERLDVFNGILLAPHLDAAFDSGFITVTDDGAVVVAAALEESARRTLAVDKPLRVRGLAESHRAYLPWHRERVFRRAATAPGEEV